MLRVRRRRQLVHFAGGELSLLGNLGGKFAEDWSEFLLGGGLAFFGA
jgi:hypothetical protein